MLQQIFKWLLKLLFILVLISCKTLYSSKKCKEINSLVAFCKNEIKQTEDWEVTTNDCFKNCPYAETIKVNFRSYNLNVVLISSFPGNF